MPSAPKSTPRDVFWYLLMIVTLYIGVVSLITLLFQYVNIQIPDPLSFYLPGALGTIRVSMASLIVVTPVFLFMSRLIERDIKKHPEKQELKVRKWLLYLTLFIASITIIIDLITLLNSFLSGELTVSFALKILIVLAIAGAVFGYYLWDIKRQPKEKTNLPKKAAVAVIVAVIVSIAGGFFFIGSPAHQRNLRFDSERVEDLRFLQSQIVSYWQAKEALPSVLADLEDPLSGSTVPMDPETEEAYEYEATGPLSFSICAIFAEESLPGTVSLRPGRFGIDEEDSFAHGPGRVCFEREIDPERYPPHEKVPVPR